MAKMRYDLGKTGRMSYTELWTGELSSTGYIELSDSIEKYTFIVIHVDSWGADASLFDAVIFAPNIVYDSSLTTNNYTYERKNTNSSNYYRKIDFIFTSPTQIYVGIYGSSNGIVPKIKSVYGVS